MKKSKKKRDLLVLLILLFIVMVLLARNSYSQYLTKIDGKGVIEVAKWAFLVNGETASITNLNLAQSYESSTLVENRIAPGTRGSFDIVIDATGSEVGINYDVKFANETNKPTNFVYTYNGEKFNSLAKVAEKLKGSILANDEVKTKTLTIGWQWDYETGEESTEINKNDVIDTQEGIANLDYTFDVIVTGTQMPTE